MENEYLRQHNLSSGVQIVMENIPRYYSFSLGIFINYGSRDESPPINGVTHLIEHMLFKGTSKKSSLEIVRLIESLGGSFDAFTTKENLVIVTKFLSEHLVEVFELILEILLESKIVEDGLDKEKSVILEEIKSNNEDPSDYVFDLLFKAVFKNHPMELPITGTIESVKNIDLLTTQKYYKEILENRIIIAVSGKFDYEALLKLAQDKLNKRVRTEKVRKHPEKFVPEYLFNTRRDFKQVHFTFGVPAIEYASPLRHHLAILNVVFGGGMSSRLFQNLREKEGLVYDVHSFADLYSDCGIFGFYLSCDKKNLRRVTQNIKKIFDEINEKKFDTQEIEIAKTYIIGNLLLSLENSTNRMLRLGRELIHLNTTIPIDEVVSRIRNITNNELNSLIDSYFNPHRYSIAAVGPIEERELKEIAEMIKS